MLSKVILFVSTVVVSLTRESMSECVISFSGDAMLRPTVVRNIGSRSVNILPKEPFFKYHEGEEISLRCDRGFAVPNSVTGEIILELNCLNGQVNGDYYSNKNYECNTVTWNIYESIIPLTWCSKPLQSYIVAQPMFLHSKLNILAEICYSFEDRLIQTMHYVVGAKSSKYLIFKNQSRFEDYEPTTKVEYFAETFVPKTISLDSYENSQIQQWLKFANFEMGAIMPNLMFNHNEGHIELGSMIDIPWWSALRLGNWQFYTEALKEHVEKTSNEYEILAGVSGTISVPIYKESCHENRNWVEIVDDEGNKIPLYIWNYLKNPKNDVEDYVIIGVNSPFFEFYNRMDIIFCRNICHQIDWLQKAYSTFTYKAMGVIFCCSVNEVIESKRLTGLGIEL
ncbi:uncharacterized protein LOC106081661 [Stomoxys calcitrans]|uniref:uncharacterized protein LOC106081661 n=1 Tax=Stomoxys calcitrans TaxID=35570 RepID=UPI0027E2A33A|nr:uncharacterized protein LOC106081661 [Stomoxys calcitrans]